MGGTGKRIVDLQTSLALLNGPKHSQSQPTGTPDEYGRVPFEHPALRGLDGLTEKAKAAVLDKRRLAGLAEKYRLRGVIRWKPRKVRLLHVAFIQSLLSASLTRRSSGAKPRELRFRNSASSLLICYSRRYRAREGWRGGNQDGTREDIAALGPRDGLKQW